jgi:hypothetical protein
MKMRVLVVAIVAALGARVALAASEGGDTWSEVQPVQRSTQSVLQSAPHVASSEPQLGTAFEGSEGGDTWSSVQALRETSDQQVAEDRRARTDTDYAGLPGGSEGGDTWSRFVPQEEGRPTGAAGFASSGASEQH